MSRIARAGQVERANRKIAKNIDDAVSNVVHWCGVAVELFAVQSELTGKRSPFMAKAMRQLLELYYDQDDSNSESSSDGSSDDDRDYVPRRSTRARQSLRDSRQSLRDSSKSSKSIPSGSKTRRKRRDVTSDSESDIQPNPRVQSEQPMDCRKLNDKLVNSLEQDDQDMQNWINQKRAICEQTLQEPIPTMPPAKPIASTSGELYVDGELIPDGLEIISKNPTISNATITKLARSGKLADLKKMEVELASDEEDVTDLLDDTHNPSGIQGNSLLPIQGNSMLPTQSTTTHIATVTLESQQDCESQQDSSSPRKLLAFQSSTQGTIPAVEVANPDALAPLLDDDEVIDEVVEVPTPATEEVVSVTNTPVQESTQSDPSSTAPTDPPVTAPSTAPPLIYSTKEMAKRASMAAKKISETQSTGGTILLPPKIENPAPITKYYNMPTAEREALTRNIYEQAYEKVKKTTSEVNPAFHALVKKEADRVFATAFK